MRSRTAIWFECKIRYEKVTEEGLQKKVTEQYVVDALSFSEAETRIIEEMAAYISGEYEITDVRKAAYKEIFFSDCETEDRWYKAKLMFITIDERTEKEKRSAVTYLVQAGTLDPARRSRLLRLRILRKRTEDDRRSRPDRHQVQSGSA